MARDFPGSPVVKTALPLHGARVRYLVGELRSGMPRGMAKKKKKKFMVISWLWLPEKVSVCSLSYHCSMPFRADLFLSPDQRAMPISLKEVECLLSISHLAQLAPF